ncbi:MULTISPECIES: DUF3426 domain-containing protein [Acinetobacter]|uniref:Zinc-ribbon and DUF3426 domain-containing protein n=1 Tax=Acinetobacter entericus TaxID=2989714 RepID=A0ABT3NEN4_9GAMM|nr:MULTISPECIES: DUF3426 domain-containing protein [Acinetobacter]MCW8038017.1 zinc-ribbon and DUF3426 domain-containing protein [Acinetobacter entericus]TCB76318.1 DUF3426 domain-containing protein [Acinetobacter sp. ANC 4177]
MSNKQTFCPTCATTYKVTVAQLTMAQGMVCCPKCSTSFNALSYLVAAKALMPEAAAALELRDPNIQFESQAIDISKLNLQNELQSAAEQPRKLLDLFEDKVENSNIDLKTYLNNLNYFSTEPIGNFPALNWSEKADTESKRGVLYYAMWSIINIALISTLLFQFFWFNPQYLKNSPVMAFAFNAACDVFNCSKLEEHYNLIATKKVKVRTISKKEVEFSGQLINYHERSLALPVIKVELKDNGTVFSTYTLQPQQYLAESLSGIQRIPSNSPFKFNFRLPVDRKSFNSYDLEIIRP